jgi:carbonic anhydrase
MKKLIQGILEFRSQLTEQKRSLFAKLALGQKPDALLIACCDSRVVPNLFASTNPGDLFVVRNIGNLIPPYGARQAPCDVEAALEFSLDQLHVQDLIVCGHSECGAMFRLNAMRQEGSSKGCAHSDHPVDRWLLYGQEALERCQDPPSSPRVLSEVNILSQVNVIVQMEHLLTYPVVQANKARIHGWWFDIESAEVYCFDADRNKFGIIDEEELLRSFHLDDQEK